MSKSCVLSAVDYEVCRIFLMSIPLVKPASLPSTKSFGV